MNHDNIMTTCYVNETDPTLDTVGFDDMANFDYAAFKSESCLNVEANSSVMLGSKTISLEYL